MGTLIILAIVGIPSTLALLWFLTPSGRRWLRKNKMM